LKKYAKKHSVDPDRLLFAGNIPKSEHLERLQLADLALDTKTVNGHTTTTDCLWAGVPVITIEGKHFASRVSASMLRAIGQPELITKDLKEYERLALSLAKNPNILLKHKQKLKSNLPKTPLFDTEKYAKNLEKAYLKMVNDGGIK
jgi:predicted O-linked N-acetylglucosamine transferase (SPINDLY family)